ncbi:MAG: hypothetical protein ACON4U_11280 [Myxococcota bacterium]
MTSFILIMALMAFANPPELSPAQDTLLRQLSYRDGAPDCKDLSNDNGQLKDDLLVMVNSVMQPPWVGMRAANCLITRFPLESVDTFKSWMQSEQTMGLAYLLGAQISQLPYQIAIEVGRVGLSGPHAEGVRSRLESQEGRVVEDLLKGETK